MLISEFTVDHPILRKPLSDVSGIKAEWEQTYERRDEPAQMIVWIATDDFEAFETALADDLGVTNPAVLTDVGARRLYRVELTELGRRTNLLPEVLDAGGVLQQAVGTNDGWRLRVQVPDRDALADIIGFCRENDIGFTFERLYSRMGDDGRTDVALTDEQREALRAAVESGYLEIPRESSLAELGDSLGISETAASERFRRAVKNLTEQTLIE
ncbi:helix-turn-helix domain-containing protein [Haloarcula salina]|uniref:Helix-turn-helix domain-containing protein n=1 Tax=Haloarcula salina TaxID=1429914 RepID=A0AA41G486_9EURY|nr:helix-turn-helix domain-containing protein [Haloarcula salina]MBV0903213.1 helix-turn-helix domain-containing protein [Haloarcula salina]